jgi:hypothetical protein
MTGSSKHFPSIFLRNARPIFAQYMSERPEMTFHDEKPKKAKRTKRKLNMKKRNITFTTILLVLGCFTIGSVPSVSASTPTPVTITGVYDFSTFPDVTGTFTTSGALTISGPSTMHVDLNYNGTTAHCVVTLIAPDGDIIIHQQCQFATSPPSGRWEIVSGTGAYANLNGNGSLTMPPNSEAMTGVIYQ